MSDMLSCLLYWLFLFNRLPKIKEWVDEHDSGAAIIPFSADLEQKLSEMSPEEAGAYMKENEFTTMLPKIIRIGYQTLQLQYFFTCGKDEVKAWTIQVCYRRILPGKKISFAVDSMCLKHQFSNHCCYSTVKYVVEQFESSQCKIWNDCIVLIDIHQQSISTISNELLLLSSSSNTISDNNP